MRCTHRPLFVIPSAPGLQLSVCADAPQITVRQTLLFAFPTARSISSAVSSTVRQSVRTGNPFARILSRI